MPNLDALWPVLSDLETCCKQINLQIEFRIYQEDGELLPSSKSFHSLNVGTL